MINIQALKQINFIIENDKTSSTYKYALLKSTIDSCQRFEHLIHFKDQQVFIPLGLVVAQWIFDYLPFVFKGIRQQHSNANGIVLNAEIDKAYRAIFDFFRLAQASPWEYAYKTLQTAFYDEYQSENVALLFFELSRKIAKTIIKMPMRYIGRDEYSFFQPDISSCTKVKLPQGQSCNFLFLVRSFGYFAINEEHYNIFRYMGQNLYGTSTIAIKWKQKTDSLVGENVASQNLIERIYSDNFAIARDTSGIRSILEEGMECVWSGKILNKQTTEIDHMLPFSIWFNNDLWNMLPADKKINNEKRDKIPTPKLIEKRANVIISYWKIYNEKWGYQFQNSILASLVGDNSNVVDYERAIEALIKKVSYLIEDRGCPEYYCS